MKKKSIDDLLKEYDVTEAWLREHYVDKSMSLPEIKKLKNISLKTTYRLLKHFGIPVRSITESRLTKRFKENLQTTLTNKYGNITNVSQLKWVQEKKEKTFKKHYGVNNIWKSKKYYEWLDKYMLETYGTKRTGFVIWNKNQRSNKTKRQWKKMDPEYKEKRIKEQLKNLSKASTKNNSIEVKVSKILEELKIKYTRFFAIERKVYDFLLPDYKIIIECNGDFWHANPNQYKADDVLPLKGRGIILAKDLWDKDKVKIKLANDHNFKVLTFWECDIKKNNFPVVFFESLQKEIKGS